MKKSSLVFGSNGTLNEPELHDGLMDGVLVEHHENTSDLILFCRDGAGTAYELKFPKLERLLINDFREGNIIFDLIQFKGSEILLDDVAKVFPDAKAEFISTWMTNRRLDYTMLIIVTSYGCEGRALLNSAESEWTCVFARSKPG